MADPSFPPSLKAIKPYLVRAKELEVARPLVSYYANLYALQRCIRERDAADELAARFITGLLAKCEKLRPQFAADVDSHRAQLEEFAFSVYDGAEREYMSGEAGELTAKRFYAAMCFFDICSHFGELPEDLAVLRQKSRIFAVKISKDIKEGRQPLPPDVPKRADDEAEEAELRDELRKSGISDAGIPSGPPREAFDAPATVVPTERYETRESPPQFPSITSVASSNSSVSTAAPVALPPSTSADIAPPRGPSSDVVPGYTPDAKAMNDAKKHSKYAASALDFQDTKTAIKELWAALDLLQGSVAPP